jgi:hypothetical protein
MGGPIGPSFFIFGMAEGAEPVSFCAIHSVRGRQLLGMRL